MKITKVDLFWSYGATFLKIASAALLFPFILSMMPSETVGIWFVFMSITAFTNLLDFGFRPSFTRNVTYVFSGVKNLRAEGFDHEGEEKSEIDYGLLKGVIGAMQNFYLRIASITFLLLITLGTYYIYTLLGQYSGSKEEVYGAWFILCLISTYKLFTSYYDALLNGKGLIKKAQQINVIGQSVYLVMASVFILLGYGLIAIVASQSVSVIIIRILYYRSFFTKQLKEMLAVAMARPKKEILKAIYPNAIKIGWTSLGGFLVTRSSIIVGSLYLTLEQIAMYGITLQLISIITGLAGIYTATFQPEIVQLRVKHKTGMIRDIYLRGQIILILTFLVGGGGLIFLGPWVLDIINSKTFLMPAVITIGALLVSFLETNHATAGNILLTKNEVPFFKASLISGCMVIILLFLLFEFSSLELWVLILAPGIAQGVYQNWKWPFEVVKDLDISFITLKRFLVNGKGVKSRLFKLKS